MGEKEKEKDGIFFLENFSYKFLNLCPCIVEIKYEFAQAYFLIQCLFHEALGVFHFLRFGEKYKIKIYLSLKNQI